MESKNIVNVVHMGCPYLPYQGGSTKRLMNIAKFISSKDDIKQFIVTPTSGEKNEAKYFDDVLRDTSINKINFNKSLWDFIRKKKVDIVVLHNSRVLLKWMLFYKFFFRKVKVIVEIHSFRQESFFTKFLNKINYKMSDRIVHLSNSSVKYMDENYGLMPSNVVYNGIDAKKTEQKKQGYNKNNTTYAYIGSFHDWQGVNLIAKSAIGVGIEFWKNNKLVLIGDGPELENIKIELFDIINEGANILIYGWQDESFINNQIESVDFLLAVRPSCVATETVFPLKIVDSIKFGIPLICTNVGGLVEVVHEKGAAFYIDKNDQNALVDFWNNKPCYREYHSVLEALSNIAKEFDSWEVAADNYHKIYRSLVK